MFCFKFTLFFAQFLVCEFFAEKQGRTQGGSAAGLQPH
jgi:hypothetical protein